MAACLEVTFAEDATSTEFSRFTNGFREAVFLTVLASATGTSSMVDLVVAARALVVLVVVGSTVRAEARVATVGFGVIALEARHTSLQDE